MGRSYAGILGAGAFVVVLARGLTHGASVDTTLAAAAVYMFLFTVFGYCVGQLAGRTVLDSLRETIATQCAAALDQTPRELRQR